MARGVSGLLLYGVLVVAFLASYGGVKRLLGWGSGTVGKEEYIYVTDKWRRRGESKALCLLVQIGCSKRGKVNQTYDNEEYDAKRKGNYAELVLQKIRMNKVRNLSDDETNVELLPYVTKEDEKHTVVNLFDYFVKGKRRANGKNEIFIGHILTLHRVVVICFKPTLNFSHIITQPSDAVHKMLTVEHGERLGSIDYPLIYYADEASWGMKNVMSTGILEFFAPPYTREVTDILIRCANTEINETYTFEDSIQIRIRIPRSSEKILGVSTDPEDSEYFEKIADENVDEYKFGSFKNRVLGFKLVDAELDPENCFKVVHVDDRELSLEIEYQFSRCLILDRPEFKLRYFYINDIHFEDEIEFSCSFTYKGKKKKVTFGEGEVEAVTDTYFIEPDKKEFQYFNGVPYKVCHFEYDEDKKNSTQVCERTINEFSLFMYNCESMVEGVATSEEAVHTVKYLNATYPLEKFSDITFFSKDVHIEHLRWKFPDYKYFMTAYINHGPHPLIIECAIPNKEKDSYQQANILLYVQTNLKDRTVSFCDFRSSKFYDYMNAYIKGDECEINVTSNTSFGFRCPAGTVKKPSYCFTEMYYLGYLYRLGDLFTQNIVIYSYKDPSFSLAAFNSSLSRSYSFECFCVKESDHSKIEKRVIVNYINEDQLYDYNAIPKVPYESVISHPMKTHLCDFMKNNSVLKPTKKKPVNYICEVFPKPMEYIALVCPTNLIDEKNEKTLSDLLYDYGKPGIIDQIRAFGKKRNNYYKSFHLPKDAPSYVINRYMQTVKSIDEMIPGALIKDTVSIKIARIKKTDAGVEDPSLPPDEEDEINQMYATHMGLPNSIHHGLFIFQLPPYIKRNAIIEFACINDKTKKMGNTGNNGIMSVHLRTEGRAVHGCHFYKDKEENSILKKKIKVGSGKDCVVQSNGEIDYIGIICPIQSGLYLTPPGCFQTAYNSSDELVQLSSYDKDFINFTNDKGVSYLKIPQSFVGHLNIFCYCNEEAPPSEEEVEAEARLVAPPKKENKINIELNTSNRGITNVQKIDHLYESDFLIGNEFINRRPTPIMRKKHICDFTREDSSLAPQDELPAINSCFVDLEENLSLVEVRCPRNFNPSRADRFSTMLRMRSFGSVAGTAGVTTRSGLHGALPLEDEPLSEEELSKYKQIKYVPEEYEDVMHLSSKKKLQDILPGTIILDRSKKFGEKGRFTFITPLIVKNDIIIKLFCDNSETVIANKKGKKGIVLVKIPKRVTKKRFYGCDFSGNSNKTFYYSEVHSLTNDNKECHIKLKENIIVSLNCPNGKINPNNCFHNVYIKSTMDQENVENVENIFNDVKVINTNYLLKNSSAFLIISKMSNTKDLNFYCTCEDYDSKNVGTIFLNLPQKQSSTAKEKYASEKKLIMDVPPYYAKDTYVCDFTEQHYNVLSRSNLDMEKLLSKYLQNILLYQHDEFTHFSLNFKLRKEIMKKQYIEYVKKQIQHYRDNPPKVENYPDHTLVYKCNIDLSAFDKFAIKCPSRGGTLPHGEVASSHKVEHVIAPRLNYTSSLGNDATSMVKGLNSLLFGTIIVNKTNEQNVSFFDKGELELIISPYADSSKNFSFSCENMGEDGTNRVIGYASIFVKKNNNKILGCDFIDPSDVTNQQVHSATSKADEGTGVTTPYGNNSFEFEIELVEGKNIYCNIEAIENDVVGFSCPHNFLTSPENCFESVQIEGVDKELETHKLESLLKGVHILKNKIYDVNYTPSYIILPKKIPKSMKIFCTCNSVKLIKTGIIQINIIGDDLNNWFKKEITHNVFAYEQSSYFYDFSSGPLNISSENVLDIGALPTGKRAKGNRHKLQGGISIDGSTPKRVRETKPSPGITIVELLDVGEEEEEEEDEDDDEPDEVEEENVLNPMRTKQVHEITVAASEFSSVKVVCPLRNAQHFRQSKISPENFFEYVYVTEDVKDNRSEAEKEKMVMELVQGKSKDSVNNGEEADGPKKRENEKDKDKDEIKVDYDSMGNKIIVALKTERPKATIEDAENSRHPNGGEEKTKKDILTIRNINDVIEFVNHEREVSENTYAGTIHFSPLLLKEAKFFISCDNSLTLNESRRGKTGIVKVLVKPNYVNIFGCDFVGDYSTHFYFSQRWEDVPKNYVCEVQVEDDSIVGLACPSHTKLHPSDCFDSVIKDNVVHKKDSLIEAVNMFIYKERNKPILSFIQVKHIFASHFSCKCYDSTKGDYKEVTIKINYEPYVMGTPKKSLGGAVIQYSDLGKLKRVLLLLPFAHIILARNDNAQVGVTSREKVRFVGLLSGGRGDGGNEGSYEGRCVSRNADPYVLGRDPFGGITNGKFFPRGVHYREGNHSLLRLLKSEDRRKGVNVYHLGGLPHGENSNGRKNNLSGAIKMVTNYLHGQVKFWNTDVVTIPHELFGVSPQGKFSTRRVARRLAEDDDGDDDDNYDNYDNDDGDDEEEEEEDDGEDYDQGENYQIKGMDLEDEDEDDILGDTVLLPLVDSDSSEGVFDAVNEGFEATIKKDGEELKESDPTVEVFSSSNTNKEYLCDFEKGKSLKDTTKKVVICEMRIQEPLVKVKIVCPTKYSDVSIHGSMGFIPKKAPYVTLVNTNEGIDKEKKVLLKEKKLAALLHGVIIDPAINEEANVTQKGIIEFILPPVVKEKKKIYYICDHNETEVGGKHVARGVVSISIEPYGKSVRGCNYTGRKKHFFTYDYEKDNAMNHPCVFQLNAGEIGGIMFPDGIKSTTCFDQMIPHSPNKKWDNKKKNLNEIINGAVIYNKDFKAQYFRVKYFSIPNSFTEKINLFCNIHLTEGDEKHMVYISINQELNISVFDLYESFSNVKKVIQVAQQTQDKKEYTCDFTDQLDKKEDDGEKKVIICRKKLTEFDTFTMKCPIKKDKYENLVMIPKTLKKEEKKKNNVLKIQLDVQYELFKKYLHFHDKYGKYLPDYPSFFTFPLNRVAKLELKKNSIFKNHKDASYFDEVASASDAFVKLLAYLDAQDTVILTKQISNLAISEDKSTDDVFDLTFQIPAYIETNEPLYILMGCNNTKDGGNLGIVELVLSKSEHIVKGCNFSDVEMKHFTNNVKSTGAKCSIVANPNDLVGFNCSKTYVPETDEEEGSGEATGVIEPEGCFTQVYNSNEKTDIVTMLPGVLIYSSGKKNSTSFIKIPPVPLKKKITFSCKCKIESVVNEIEVTVAEEKEIKKESVEVLKEEAITTVKGKDQEEDGKIYTCPNKTLIEPKLEKIDDLYVQNTCHIDVKEMHSYVEIYCPSKDFAIHKNINMYYTTVKPKKEESPKVLNQLELDKIIPHAEMLHKTRNILPLQSTTNDMEKVDLSHVYLFFPYYVKEEQEFNVICDNSNTLFGEKKGGVLSYQIKVPKRSKQIKGCDFNSKKSEIFLNQPTENDCVIDAMPKDVIGFVCPPETVKITSCFKDAVVDDHLTNIADTLELTDNMANYTHSHKFNYIEIPRVVSKDLSFKCICVHLKKDYQLTSPPSAKLLDVIYQKLDIKKGEGYTKVDAKKKFLMSSLNPYLAHKEDKVISIFQEVDKNNPFGEDEKPEEIIQDVAKTEFYHDTLGSTGSLSQIRDNHISGDDYSIYTNVNDNVLERTIMADIEKLNKSDFKVYTLSVNVKAPKLLQPKKLNENEYLCDFSKKSLIVPEPLTEDSPLDIHCYSALKPLDTLYVKCPTEKAAYEDAKTKTADDDDEAEKGIISILDDVSGAEDSGSPLEDESFVKYFDKISMKPSEFFKKVLNEDGDKEEDIDLVLPGAAYTSMKVLKKKDPFTSYVAVIVPPTVSRNTFFKVECNNNEYKEGGKNAGYKGIIHLNISRSGEKTIGCDFTSEHSSILTKGVLLPSGQEKECEVEVTKNDVFGVRCSNDSTFDPVKCFHEIHDKTGSVKQIKELIPGVKVFTLPNSKTKVAYGKIPLDYVNKINFSCTCTKTDDNTKGKIKVVVNKDEYSLEDMKLTDAVKHGKVNFCNFFDDEALIFKKNPDKIVQCKVDAELFSEVVVMLPQMGSTNDEPDYKNFAVTPTLSEGEDIKVITDARTEVPITTALKGVYGSRVFSFEKNSKKGIGLSFFIPPTFEDKNFKLAIKESAILTGSKQRGVIFVIVRKNMEPGSVKMCDFTSSENSLAELDQSNNEKVCSVKIAKGDIFGITCPKGFCLYPEACFSNVTLDYYKGELHMEEAEAEGNNEEINFAERTKTNMRIKDLLHLIGDDDSEMEDLQKFSEFSNITEMLNFETFHLGSMHLDFKKNYTSSYAKVPSKFRSAIKFSCSCYNPQKKVFGTMDIETEYAPSEEEPKIQEDKFVRNKLLPLRSKISLDADEVEPIEEVDTEEDSGAAGSEGCTEDGSCGNMLSQGISYTCDFSQESLFTLIEGKVQRNTCTVDARALDVVTIKCPAIANHVHKENTVTEPVETEKVIITIDGEQYVTYQEEKTKKKTFSLKEIYEEEYYGMTSEEATNMRKVDAGWDNHEVYYPKRVLDHVVVANKVTKLEDALPGVLHLQSKINEELKTTELIKDGVVRFMVPPYVRDDFQFHLFCGKSSEKKPQGKNTSLGVIRINVSAYKKELQGCDFINHKEDPDLVIFTNEREKSNDHICSISLIPNTVVGINCPSGKLLPDSCFHETYFVAKSEEKTEANQMSTLPKEKITNVIKGAIPVSNFSNKKNTYTYLILPKDMKSLEKLDKNFYCTCDEGIVKMKIHEFYIKREKNNRVDKETCSYDSAKNVTTCNVVEFLENLEEKDNKTNHYTVNLSRWDKVILKYPTNEKENYGKIFVNPINIKDKVLYKNVPTPLEDILPGAITTHKFDSRTKIIEHTLRVPPYVSKEVNFFLEFNNSLTHKMVDYNYSYGGVVKIFFHVREGYSEISGCDFTGKYNHLFSHNFDPNIKESTTCSVTFGNNSYAGFACPREFEVVPHNCFTSVYDNNDDKKVKKLVDLSQEAESDFVQYNARGVSLSYVTFKKDTKGHSISCKCVSKKVTHTINVTFEPDADNSLPKTRIRIRYFDLSKASFSSHLRGG
ncbi:Transmission-blocking target antigen s230 [Plasmodium coatneyi]|uniref:Transmission-blocking target antigen s230 n=1 Tax=Plasmodium coatneyi TaxID=208452 RepID=A0A1B1DU55_9APIC|nr:Transmission-blocking target antigen s230 [Plasmodium coatneyi]ANQ06303.1 Transmission-blocking target antigen s230 [Plasmodium coatneyi]